MKSYSNIEIISFAYSTSEFDLPDTFASWFVVMELHVYLVAVRVFKREAIGIDMRDMITDAFWDDVQLRAGQLGVSRL